ncbi:hypothetical protein DVH24_033972 [Malus domestica]|uniref:Uncharacterized protein n=1 Tax=Malus domestica TaxID=3750 RepID=A0A498KUF7_MALDO|nr:hypothetical protein DVH24_033972 [Malus domestica]
MDHFPSPLHHRNTILSALGPDHALTVLFLKTHEQLPSESPILGVLWPPSPLTSEFRRNPKPVSSQKPRARLGEVRRILFGRLGVLWRWVLLSGTEAT